jgi:hypothetical protein
MRNEQESVGTINNPSLTSLTHFFDITPTIMRIDVNQKVMLIAAVLC